MVAIVAVSLISLGIFWNFVLKDEESRRIEGNLAYLQKAFQTYASDARKENRAKLFPSTLKELVDENYLNEVELSELTRGVKITYAPPEENMNVIEARVEGKIYFFALDGPVGVREDKK